MVGDYALVSEKEMGQLKDEVKSLKKNPLGGTVAGKSLQEDIGKLNQAINDLVGIFKEASDQMKLEDKETDIISRKIDPLFEKLDLLIDQNQKIAKGIVAVADIVSEHLPRVAPQVQRPIAHPARPMPRMVPPSMPGPRLPPPGPLQPMPGSLPPPGARPMSPGGLPPLTPPKKEVKKGLFGGLLSK